MPEAVNRQVVPVARPAGYPKESDFKIIESPVPEPKDGQVLLRTLWLSLDPYQRVRMSIAPLYTGPDDIGEVMVGGVVAKAVASRNPDFVTGDIVQGRLGWQDYAISDGTDLEKVNPDAAPISTALGILGMPGLTAYFGLLEVGQPKPGDTVVVSAAAGAVGSVVGQLAKLSGCRVVGIAGTQAKIDCIVSELGFDAGINYKTEDVRSRLATLCPRGVDVYFDNVGGVVTDAVFELLASRARIVLCGQISQYNLETSDLGPRLLWTVLTRQARVEGINLGRFGDRFGEGQKRLAQWWNEGKLKYKEDVVDGLEKAPRAFVGLMRGENLGKLLVKVSDG